MINMSTELLAPDEEQPNETLYVNNLDDKLKPAALKRALIPLFGRFGKIADVIAMKSLWRRGQAWVVFESAEKAIKAQKALHGKFLRDKPMRVSFAKAKSDATLKSQGKPITRQKLEKLTAEQSAAKLIERAHRKKQATLNESDESIVSLFRTSVNMTRTTRPIAIAPHRTLFIEGLSNSSNVNSIENMFRAFEGFQEVRVVPGRGVAFVDYLTESQATRAMTILDGKALDGNVVKITYAKK